MEEDDGLPSRHPSASTRAGVPLIAYERGLALDEAGQSEAAAYQLRRVIQILDAPVEKHRTILADAKQKLERIEKGDAPVEKSVGGVRKQ